MRKQPRRRSQSTAPTGKHLPIKPLQNYDVATVFGSSRSSGEIERVADDYDVPEDDVRKWAVHGHISDGRHLRMFARLAAMEKTVDPAVFGFHEDDSRAVALTRLMMKAREGTADA